MPFAAVHESFIGTFRNCRGGLTMSAHRGKADLATAPAQVRKCGFSDLPTPLTNVGYQGKSGSKL